MRKIVQVAVATRVPELDGDGLRDKSQEVVVTAVCDDGSAWLIRPEEHNPQWECLPQIPQS